MIFRLIVAQRHDGPGGTSADPSPLGLSDLEIRRAFFFQTDVPPGPDDVDALRKYLADPVLETATIELVEDCRAQVWVAYKPGIVDNESDSLLRLCRILGVPATAAKVATLYLSRDPRLLTVVTERRFNPNIEEIHTAEPKWDTLLPVGHYTPAARFDLRGLSAEDLLSLGRADGRNLDLAKMQHLRHIQECTGLDAVTDVLLEALDARWSDHCYHTTWKSLGQLLRKLIAASEATGNPNIASMFSDNAGIWHFYEGHCLVIKGETHNGPSAISAYFGQLTKLGGVLRDILGAGLGADPIGTFEYTATGLPGTDAPMPNLAPPRHVANETIRAIKEYGNTFGVPMMWSRMSFHPAYRAKPFALGGAIGLIASRFANKGRPEPGDLVVLIGGLTGNDGIHGASASSAGAEMDRTTVQIGSPLEEVKFNTAIADLRDGGCLRAITDVGGAGLNSAVGEMGDPAGVWINTALVPLKTAGLPMWRILLSESQERMVLAVKPDRLAEARDILARHEVRHTVIGRFTGKGRYTVVHDPALDEAAVVSWPSEKPPLAGEVGLDAPYTLLDFTPEPLPPPCPPPRSVAPTRWPEVDARRLAEILPALLADVEVADQSFADSQYDSTVQGRQVYGPYAGDRLPVRTAYWAGVALPSTPYAAVFATAFNAWLYQAHPTLALRQCFCELVAKLALAGVRIRDVAICDNFYTPHLSEGWDYWLVSMVDELAALVRRFGTPVISGKDSSAGSVATDDGLLHVPPAVFLSAIGKADSFDRLLRNEWRGPESVLVKIGPTCRSAAGTVASRVLGLDATDVDEVDPGAFHAYVRALEAADRAGWLSGVPIGAGGLLATLFERVVSSGRSLELDEPPEGLWWLLAEHRGAAVIEVEAGSVASIAPALEPRVIGRVTGTSPSIRVNGAEILGAEATRAWRSSFVEALR